MRKNIPVSRCSRKINSQPPSRLASGTSFVSISQRNVGSTPSIGPLHAIYSHLTIPELKANSEALRKENRTIELENMVLERYLNKVEPSLIANIDEVLEARVRTGSMSSAYLVASATSARSRQSVTRLASLASKNAGGSINRRSYGKINLPSRIELTKEYIKDLDDEIEKYKQKCEKVRYDLTSEYEEITLRIGEIKNTHQLFDNEMTAAKDPMTKRIPGEALIRFMIGWLKKAELSIESLRLTRNHNMKLHRKLQVQLAEKEELGETIHPIDFEQISIINDQLMKEIGAKGKTLLQVKNMTAQSGLKLAVHTKFLNFQLGEMKQLGQMVAAREAEITRLKEETDRMLMEKEKALAEWNRITQLTTNFTVPKLMDYVNLRAELTEMIRLIKVWNRKRKIQEIELKSSRALCKGATLTNVRPKFE